MSFFIDKENPHFLSLFGAVRVFSKHVKVETHDVTLAPNKQDLELHVTKSVFTRRGIFPITIFNTL